MPYSAESKATARTFNKEVRASTVCVDCGAQPIDWHHRVPREPNQLMVADLVSLGFSLERIKAEIALCDPLCRRCHQSRDGRRNNLQVDTKGEKNGRAKLTREQVAIIKYRLSKGETQTALAREYGVNQTAIGFIHRGLHWADVEPAVNGEY